MDGLNTFSFPVPLEVLNEIWLKTDQVALKKIFLFYPIALEGRRGTTDEFATTPFHLVLFPAALVELAKLRNPGRGISFPIFTRKEIETKRIRKEIKTIISRLNHFLSFLSNI